MRNKLKSNIFIIILCGIIFTSIGVYASSYLATDITYTPTDEAWEVSNVEEAINSLYSNITYGNGIDLLWEGTEASYANGYKIELDLTDYSHVIVQCVYMSTLTFTTDYLIGIGESREIRGITTGNAVSHKIRIATVEEDGITFTNASSVERTLPRFVYGIRK